MTSHKLIGLALLVILLTPALVAIADRRRLSDIFRVLLAIGGLGYCWITGGLSGLLLGLCSGLGTMLVLTLLVAFTQRFRGARVLSGGEIKQLAGCSCWLLPPAAATFVATVFFLALIAVIAGNKYGIRMRNEALIVNSSLGLVLVFAFFA